MLVKKLNKLVGLKKSEFDEFVKGGQIHLSQARWFCRINYTNL